MSLKLKDPNVTKDTIDRIKDLLTYFEDVVLVTPKGLYKLHNITPARGDDRLYVHGVNIVEKEE